MSADEIYKKLDEQVKLAKIACNADEALLKQLVVSSFKMGAVFGFRACDNEHTMNGLIRWLEKNMPDVVKFEGGSSQ